MWGSDSSSDIDKGDDVALSMQKSGVGLADEESVAKDMAPVADPWKVDKIDSTIHAIHEERVYGTMETLRSELEHARARVVMHQKMQTRLGLEVDEAMDELRMIRDHPARADVMAHHHDLNDEDVVPTFNPKACLDEREGEVCYSLTK